jgi:hypothetical protein
MSKIKSLFLLSVLAFTLTANAQTPVTAPPVTIPLVIVPTFDQQQPPPIPTTPAGVLDQGGQWIANANTNVNLFGDNELEFRLGGVYIQSSGDGGASIEGEYWGLFKKNVGIGAAVVQGNVDGKAGTGAAYIEIAYRKTFGDVSASVFVGPGYDFQNRSLMGVVGARISKRINAHAGMYVGLGYAVESLDKNRGIITGAGVTYSW